MPRAMGSGGGRSKGKGSQVDTGASQAEPFGSLGAGLRQIGRMRKADRRESMGDYRVALNAVRAGQGNLRNQLGKSGRLLDTTQRRAQQGLRDVAAGARQNAKFMRASEQRATNRFGSALGGAVALAAKPGEVAANQETRKTDAAVRQGRINQNVVNMTEDLGAQEAKAQMGAAKYELAQALQQRTIIDNNTLAGLEGNLYQTAVQYKMQFDNFKKQQEYVQGKLPEQASATAHALSTEGVQIAGDAKTIWQQTNKPGEPFDMGAALTAFQQQSGYASTSPQAQLFAATMNSLRQQAAGGVPHIGAAYQDAVQQLYGGQEGFTPDLIALMNGAVTTDQNREYLQNILLHPENTDLSGGEQGTGLGFAGHGVGLANTSRGRAMGY